MQALPKVSCLIHFSIKFALIYKIVSILQKNPFLFVFPCIDITTETYAELPIYLCNYSEYGKISEQKKLLS